MPLPAGPVRFISFAPALLAAVQTGYKTVTRRRIALTGLQAAPAHYALGGLHADEAFFEAVSPGGKAEWIACPFGKPGDWLQVVEDPTLMLRIGSIWAEPVRSITEAGALAEGIAAYPSAGEGRTATRRYGVRGDEDEHGCQPSAVAAFARLLDAIYPTAWARNEWVWVVEFQLGSSE